MMHDSIVRVYCNGGARGRARTMLGANHGNDNTL